MATRQPGKAMEPQRDREGTLMQVVETLLDKGLVLNADIMVSVAGVELLGIRIRAALASFETAAKFGLDFPAGTDRETAAWQEAMEEKDTCPECGKRASLKQLMDTFCPWCGWQSAYARSLEQSGAEELESDEGEPLPETTGEDAEEESLSARSAE
ncbi:gas vesicle protein GvpJ [Nesterenkonia sp. NBAIMH1]|uniref:gas vesicle protein GvpJ n=1 Tax=Nesterenkonia sp. NBAIMH1 TaxID=2600320 RepID=UPI002739A65C|nr:gas vesicle protein GvpJ [Nesterenkonia sp. NBAIMH1]